ncbi:MAG: DUF3800 domain-containing protein [Roseobacter sp.]
MANPHFTLFVDESGDQDLERYRTEPGEFGSDPYLVFGAALVPTSSLEDFRGELQEILKTIESRALHCTDISHLKRAYFARKVAGMQVLLFGVVSKKDTVGEYQKKIEGDNKRQDYYNKCAVYLLERVGHFMSIHNYSSEQLSVVFEKKNHNYQRLRNFVRTIRKTPYDSRARFLERVDPLSIRAEGKKDEILLSLADLTAFSIYQSITETNSNFRLPEQRYLRELKDKFWKDPENGQVAEHGLKYITGLEKMRLQGDALKLAQKFYRKNTD